MRALQKIPLDAAAKTHRRSIEISDQFSLHSYYTHIGRLADTPGLTFRGGDTENDDEEFENRCGARFDSGRVVR